MVITIGPGRWADLLEEIRRRAGYHAYVTVGALHARQLHSLRLLFGLSDVSFTEKGAHLKGDLSKDCLVISTELHDVGTWDERVICGRTARLTTRLLGPGPELSAEIVASHGPAKRASFSRPFSSVCSVASAALRSTLFVSDAGRSVVAEITDGYGTRFSNGGS